MAASVTLFPNKVLPCQVQCNPKVVLMFFFSHSKEICFAHWLRILGQTSKNIPRYSPGPYVVLCCYNCRVLFANFAIFLFFNYFLTIILILGVILFQVGLV